MDEMQVPSQAGFGLSDVLEDERTAAQEQLQAAWQLHVARVEQQLAAGWDGHIQKVVAERFSELTRRIEAGYRADLSCRIEETRAAARRDVGGRLGSAARRMRQSLTPEELYAALLEEAAAFCARAVTLVRAGQSLRVTGARGFGEDVLAALLREEVPLESAPALSNVAESMDTVVASRTQSELSGRLTWLLGEAPDAKSFLLPVTSRGKVVAVLYAELNAPDDGASVLELLTAMAGAVLEAAQPAPVPAAEEGLVSIAPASHPPARPAPPDWAGLGKEDREAHLRAQRFARVQVAELRLYHAKAVKSGRLRGNLYAELKGEIDAARDSFRLQFVVPCSSMVDYLHLEILSTLANNDAALLGPEYPGALV